MNQMTAQDYIQKLQLMPHPEGGYFKQLFGNDETGKKDISTIYYMLTNQDISAFHRLHNVVEIWYCDNINWCYLLSNWIYF